MGRGYQPGDLLGPYQIEMIERTIKTAGGHWKAKFLCPNHPPEDPHYFETYITSVTKGEKKCCAECTKNNWGGDNFNLVGQKFGHLTVLEKTSKRQANSIIYKCVCDCDEHNVKEVSARHLKEGLVRSCGCLQREASKKAAQIMNEKKKIDLTNQKSGTWTALYRIKGKRKNGSCVWMCQCENGHYNEISTGNWGKIKTCRQCKTGRSLGEEKIQKILNKLQINFKEEYSFKDCVYKRPLRFDFYLSNYNCCIEYDGIQHFQPTNFSHDNFKERQEKDNIKTQYCKNNNIKLIRIPYTDIDLINEQYIIDKLKEYGIILLENK